MKKKILALTLAVVTTCAAIPTTAFADELEAVIELPEEAPVETEEEQGAEEMDTNGELEVTNPEATRPGEDEMVVDETEEEEPETPEETSEDVVFDEVEIVDGVEVRVTADAGVFPEGSTLQVTALPMEMFADTITEQIGSDVTMITAFDITIWQDGIEVQPDTTKGNVYVTYGNANTNAEAEDTAVYYVSDDFDTVEEISATNTADGVEFAVEHFSYYIWVEHNTENGFLSYRYDGPFTLDEVTGKQNAAHIPVKTVFDALGIDYSGAYYVSTKTSFYSSILTLETNGVYPNRYNFYAGKIEEAYFDYSGGSSAVTYTLYLYDSEYNRVSGATIRILTRNYSRVFYNKKQVLNAYVNGSLPTDTNEYTTETGMTATVLDYGDLSCADADVKCWNTKPDGSGTSYQPGDTIALEENTDIHLYLILDIPTFKVGEQVTAYYFPRSKTLTFAQDDNATGFVQTYDYNSWEDVPYHDMDIDSITFDGINGIGDYCMYKYPNSSLNLPADIQYIGNYNFVDTPNLTQIMVQGNDSLPFFVGDGSFGSDTPVVTQFDCQRASAWDWLFEQKKCGDRSFKINVPVTLNGGNAMVGNANSDADMFYDTAEWIVGSNDPIYTIPGDKGMTLEGYDFIGWGTLNGAEDMNWFEGEQIYESDFLSDDEPGYDNGCYLRNDGPQIRLIGNWALAGTVKAYVYNETTYNSSRTHKILADWMYTVNVAPGETFDITDASYTRPPLTHTIEDGSLWYNCGNLYNTVKSLNVLGTSNPGWNVLGYEEDTADAYIKRLAQISVNGTIRLQLVRGWYFIPEYTDFIVYEDPSLSADSIVADEVVRIADYASSDAGTMLNDMITGAKGEGWTPERDGYTFVGWAEPTPIYYTSGRANGVNYDVHPNYYAKYMYTYPIFEANTPSVPDTPVVPDVPDVPDTPNVPDTPSNSGGGDTPTVPVDDSVEIAFVIDSTYVANDTYNMGDTVRVPEIGDTLNGLPLDYYESVSWDKPVQAVASEDATYTLQYKLKRCVVRYVYPQFDGCDSTYVYYYGDTIDPDKEQTKAVQYCHEYSLLFDGFYTLDDNDYVMYDKWYADTDSITLYGFFDDYVPDVPDAPDKTPSKPTKPSDTPIVTPISDVKPVKPVEPVSDEPEKTITVSKDPVATPEPTEDKTEDNEPVENPAEEPEPVVQTKHKNRRVPLAIATVLGSTGILTWLLWLLMFRKKIVFNGVLFDSPKKGVRVVNPDERESWSKWINLINSGRVNVSSFVTSIPDFKAKTILPKNTEMIVTVDNVSTTMAANQDKLLELMTDADGCMTIEFVVNGASLGGYRII